MKRALRLSLLLSLNAAPARPTDWEGAQAETRVVLAAAHRGSWYRRLALNVAAHIARGYLAANRGSFGLGPSDEPGPAHGRMLPDKTVLLRFPAQRHRGLEVLGTEIRVAVDMNRKIVLSAEGRWLAAEGAPLVATLSASEAKRKVAGLTASCRERGGVASLGLRASELFADEAVLDPDGRPGEPARWRLRQRLYAVPRPDWSYELLVDAQTGALVSCVSVN